MVLMIISMKHGPSLMIFIYGNTVLIIILYMIVGDTNNDIVYSTDDISMLSLLDNIFMI